MHFLLPIVWNIVLYIVSLILIGRCILRDLKQLSNLSVIVFVIVNIYLIVPTLSYLLTGTTDILDTYFSLERYKEYILINFMFNLSFMVLLRKSKMRKWDVFLKCSIYLSTFLIIIGIVSLFIQLYLTGSFNLISTQNKGLILSNFYSFPAIYEYPFFIGVYLFFSKVKGLKHNLSVSVLNIFLVLTYIYVWIKIGSRGEVLIVFLIFLIALNVNKYIYINSKTLSIGVVLIVTLLITSIVNRWQLEFNITEVASLIAEKPEVLSLGNLEYNWALRNFNNLEAVNFESKYPLEPYLYPILAIPRKLTNTNSRGPIKRYRDIYHSERKEKGGDYSSTGFSLFYEAKMSFGVYFAWIPFLIFFILLDLVDRHSKKNEIIQIASILILPNFLVIARSGLPFMFIITKILYAIVLIRLLSMFTNAKILKSSV